MNLQEEFALLAAAFGKKLVQSAVEHALNYAGQHLTEGTLKDEALLLLNKVKELLA